MKNLIRYKNKVYRRYSTDLWGEIIMKGRLTRMFKFLMQIFNLRLKTYYLKFKFSWNKFRKKKIFLKKKYVMYRDFDSFYKGSMKQKLTKAKIKDKLNVVDRSESIIPEEKEESIILKNHKTTATNLGVYYLENYVNIDCDNEHYTDELNNWKSFFLNNLDLFYFNNLNIKKKKKIKFNILFKIF